MAQGGTGFKGFGFEAFRWSYHSSPAIGILESHIKVSS
jgi:hypothetical protein